MEDHQIRRSAHLLYLTFQNKNCDWQLTSNFIGYRLSHAITKQPTQFVSTLQLYIKEIFDFRVKYVKAWRAKQIVLRMEYGDWESLTVTCLSSYRP